MAPPDSVTDSRRKVSLRTGVQYVPTDPAIQIKLSTVLPWTNWRPVPGKKIAFEVNPTTQLLWRFNKTNDVFGGSGVEGRLRQEELCVGPVCFLNSLSVSGGYGGGTGVWEGGSFYVSGLVSVAQYLPDKQKGSFSLDATTGITYFEETLFTTGLEATIPVHTIKPQGPEDLNPKDYFTTVGAFIPGRVTYLYYPVELQDENGTPLHPPIPQDQRQALIEQDRKFIFDIKDSPLKGLGGNVNILISKEAVPVRIRGGRQALEKLHGEKASDIVNVWEHHKFVQELVAAHPEYFGSNVQAVAQIPYDLRDQFTWFRFDKASDLVEAATASWTTRDWRSFLIKAASILSSEPDSTRATQEVARALIMTKSSRDILKDVFPELSVPLGWHAVGTGNFKVDLSPLPTTVVPQSSVVLFHELFGHGGTASLARECRGSDEYSEGSLEDFLREHPREAALVRVLGEPIDVNDLLERIVSKAPSSLRKSLSTIFQELPLKHQKINLLTLLTEAALTQEVVGKPLGQPNVLPDDPAVIEEVWGKIPGFKEHLWTKESGREPLEGDIRIVPGGYYFPDRPFIRTQVRFRGGWRDTYMKDSNNPEAPIGPIMEHCLKKTRGLILKNAGN